MPGRLRRRLQQWFPMAQGAGDRRGVDPLLILAILDRESLGGVALNPQGPEGTGDNGNGLGLMQIDRRAFPEWCAHKLSDGRFVWQDPVLNIDKGTEILRECLDAFDGDEFLAACAYNAGISHIRHVVSSFPSPTNETLQQAADQVTTGHNYGSDVLGRRVMFRIAMSTPYPEDDEEPSKS